MAEEDAPSCTSCIFRLRFGFRRAIFKHLFLTNGPLVAFVRKLGIKGDGDVARVMRVFLKVDMRGTHKVDIETFFEYFGIEFTEYNKRAFRLLAFGGQEDHSKERRGSTRASTTSLTFDQFFVSMYNYGTLIHEALVRFAFDVMASGKEFCTRQDVIELMSLLHSDVQRVKDTTSSLMGIMDPHNRNKIAFDTFRKEEKRLGSMLFPAFKLQKILRSKVLGQWFWRRATKKRRKARLIGADLSREYQKLKAEQAQKLQSARSGARDGRGEAEAAGPVSKQVGDHDNPAPTVPATDDEGYQPEAEEAVADSESSSTSSSSSDNGYEQQQQQQQQQSRRASSAVGRVPRRVSYATGGGPRASVSSGVGGRGRGDDGMRRRTSNLKASAEARRRSYLPAPSNNVASVPVAAAPESGNRRKSSVSMKTLSSQAVPGRRGSMFEDMKVFDPSIEPTAARRRSTRKMSRVTPTNRRPTVSAAEEAYPQVIEEEQ